MVRYKGIVEGRVQGVGFRYFTKQLALETELTGWVKNTPEGTVEFEVQGSRSAVRSFMIKIQQAKNPAKVTNLSLKNIHPLNNETKFKIIYS